MVCFCLCMIPSCEYPLQPGWSSGDRSLLECRRMCRGELRNHNWPSALSRNGTLYLWQTGMCTIQNSDCWTYFLFCFPISVPLTIWGEVLSEQLVLSSRGQGQNIHSCCICHGSPESFNALILLTGIQSDSESWDWGDKNRAVQGFDWILNIYNYM